MERDIESRLRVNVLANVFQTLMAAILLFLLYRYIGITLGIDRLGIWSVVVGAVSVSRVADLGIGASVTRFVARDRARDDFDGAGGIVDTAALALMAIMGVALFSLYFALVEMLPVLFEEKDRSLVLEILPLSLVSLWLNTVATVFQGGLDGCERMAIRAGLVISSQILLLALSIGLTPSCGLIGLVWAQIAQGAFLLIIGRALLRLTLPELNWVPRGWSMAAFREMIGYGLKFQVASVAVFFLDPAAKMFMTKFGGASAAGYFEIANQVAIRLRALVVAANQAIVPRVAMLGDTDISGVRGLYRKNIRVLVFAALPITALTLIAAPLLSWIMVGVLEDSLVFLIVLLTIAWAVNSINAPAYFINLGSGRVGRNAISHVIMAVLNLGLGWYWGGRFGDTGVAWAYATAIMAGSLFLLVEFHRDVGLKFGSLVGREHQWLIVVCIIIGVVALLFNAISLPQSPICAIGALFVSTVFVGIAMWLHPIRKAIRG